MAIPYQGGSIGAVLAGFRTIFREGGNQRPRTANEFPIVLLIEGKQIARGGVGKGCCVTIA